MKKDLTPQQKELAQAMSEISEKSFCAGWLKNLEYVLWHALKNGERPYGQDSITTSDIENLQQLSTAAGCWIYFDSYKEETAIILNQWEVLYQALLSKDPNILNE